MAISTPTLLNSAVSAVSASAIVSGSFTPAGNALLIVSAGIAAATQATRLPVTIADTFSPALTWTLIQDDENQNAVNTDTATIASWWAITPASPGSGTVTATFADTANRLGIQVLQVETGFHATTPVLQSSSNNGQTSTLTITLSSTPLAGSLVIGGVVSRGVTSVTPDTDYTELSDITAGTNHAAEVQYKNGSADTTIAWSALSTNCNAAWAAEVQEAAGGGSTVSPTAISAVGATVGETVKGSVILTPTASGGIGASLGEVVAGSASSSPTPANSIGETAGQAVAGSISLSPVSASSVGVSVGGDVATNALLSPSPVSTVGGTTGETIAGSAISSPAAISTVGETTGEIVLGSASSSPVASATVGETAGEAVLGSVSLSPSSTSSIGETTGEVVLGSISLSPSPSTAIGETVRDAVLGGGGELLGNPALRAALTRYYKLDEASGTRAEAIAAENLTDNNTVSNGTGYVYPLAAFFVKANTESLSRADNTTLSLGGDVAFSWMVWLNLSDVNNNAGSGKSILGKWFSSNAEYELDIVVNGEVRFVIRNAANTAFVATPGVAITANAWHMVVMRHDPVANQIALSVDDGTLSTAALSGGVFDGTNAFRIGGSNIAGNANFTDGLIGPVGLWRAYVFSAADITYLYNNGNGVTLEQLSALTPTPDSSVVETVAPTVVKGSVVLTPTPASVVSSIIADEPNKGSAIAIPTAISGISDGSVTVILGSVSLELQASSLGETVNDAPLVGGGLIEPVPATSAGETTGIGVKGSVVVIPVSASIVVLAIGSIIKGSVSLSPSVAQAIGLTVQGSILVGSPTIEPAVAQVVGGTVGPTVLIPSNLRDRGFKGMARAIWKGMR